MGAFKRRYELGMSLDYVMNWSIVDAIREIFQNALDGEIENPENKWYFNYDAGTQILQVGNKQGSLDASTLLLGSSSKKDDSKTIGKHGEGYKVAMIVLLRNGCGVRVLNYVNREIWEAKVISSKRYGCDIGVVDVNPLGILKEAPENNLIFEVTGITEDVYEKIKENNLWLQGDVGDVIESEGSRILLKADYKGKIYVKGLYVCTKKEFTYGYDLDPSLVNLDRDRMMVDFLQLQFTTSEVILGTNNKAFIKSCLNIVDGEYLRFYWNSNNVISEMKNEVYSEFRRQYGENAVPVKTNDEFNSYTTLGVKAIMVNGNQYELIKGADAYVEEEVESPVSLALCRLEGWFVKTRKYLPKELYGQGEKVISNIKELYKGE